MRYPAQGSVTQGFSSSHLAVDIGGQTYFGTPIVAPHAGKITAAGQMGSGTNDAGLAIDVTGGQLKSRLAHNDQILVSVGQDVSEGQQIGTQGFTGYTQPDNTKAGTHCHWVLWDNGVRVDGRNYINNNGEDMANLSHASIQTMYNIAFDKDVYPVPADVFTAYDGKPHDELLTHIESDPTYIAHKQQVNNPPSQEFEEAPKLYVKK